MTAMTMSGRNASAQAASPPAPPDVAQLRSIRWSGADRRTRPTTAPVRRRRARRVLRARSESSPAAPRRSLPPTAATRPHGRTSAYRAKMMAEVLQQAERALRSRACRRTRCTNRPARASDPGSVQVQEVDVGATLPRCTHAGEDEHEALLHRRPGRPVQAADREHREGEHEDERNDIGAIPAPRVEVQATAEHEWMVGRALVGALDRRRIVGLGLECVGQVLQAIQVTQASGDRRPIVGAMSGEHADDPLAEIQRLADDLIAGGVRRVHTLAWREPGRPRCRRVRGARGPVHAALGRRRARRAAPHLGGDRPARRIGAQRLSSRAPWQSVHGLPGTDRGGTHPPDGHVRRARRDLERRPVDVARVVWQAPRITSSTTCTDRNNSFLSAFCPFR